MSMPLRPLGRTGLHVSLAGLGTMTWGEQNTEQQAHEQLDYALAQGINFIDVAEMYPVPPKAQTQGRTEQYLGTWLKARGMRSRVAVATKAPTTEETVPRYVGDPFGIPRMGTHWSDQDSHEFHGQPFTSTIIYGFYDGKMIFIEPMMTKAFLDSKPDETKPLRVPSKYPKAGRYPSSYRVVFDDAAKEYRVEMLAFVSRQ